MKIVFNGVEVLTLKTTRPNTQHSRKTNVEATSKKQVSELHLCFVFYMLLTIPLTKISHSWLIHLLQRQLNKNILE